jgi:indolepyruvate ferredoxin oxidoreductase beta subunit
LVGIGKADLVIGMEPVEALRYLPYLSPSGTVLSAIEPVINIPDYPDLDDILGALRTLPRARLVDAGRLARRAGSARAANMVMVGAASRFLPLAPRAIEAHIRERFAHKSERVVEVNLRAFRSGRDESHDPSGTGRAEELRSG